MPTKIKLFANRVKHVSGTSQETGRHYDFTEVKGFTDQIIKDDKSIGNELLSINVEGNLLPIFNSAEFPCLVTVDEEIKAIGGRRVTRYSNLEMIPFKATK